MRFFRGAFAAQQVVTASRWKAKAISRLLEISILVAVYGRKTKGEVGERKGTRGDEEISVLIGFGMHAKQNVCKDMGENGR